MTARCDRLPVTYPMSSTATILPGKGCTTARCTCDSWRCQGRRLCGCQESGRRVGDQKGGVRGRLEEKGQLGGARDWMEGRGTVERR